MTASSCFHSLAPRKFKHLALSTRLWMRRKWKNLLEKTDHGRNQISIISLFPCWENVEWLKNGEMHQGPKVWHIVHNSNWWITVSQGIWPPFICSFGIKVALGESNFIVECTPKFVACLELPLPVLATWRNLCQFTLDCQIFCWLYGKPQIKFYSLAYFE